MSGFFLTLKIKRPCLAKEILSDQETDMASQSADHNLQRLDSMERKDIKNVSKRVDLLEQREKFQPPLQKIGDKGTFSRVGRQKAQRVFPCRTGLPQTMTRIMALKYPQQSCCQRTTLGLCLGPLTLEDQGG